VAEGGVIETSGNIHELSVGKGRLIISSSSSLNVLALFFPRCFFFFPLKVFDIIYSGSVLFL